MTLLNTVTSISVHKQYKADFDSKLASINTRRRENGNEPLTTCDAVEYLLSLIDDPPFQEILMTLEKEPTKRVRPRPFERNSHG